MSDDEWKQSAVFFYVAGCVLTTVSFTLCVICTITRNSERTRNFKKSCCWCCISDPMVAYRPMENAEESVELLPEDNMFSIGGEDDKTEGCESDEMDVDLGIKSLELSHVM